MRKKTETPTCPTMLKKRDGGNCHTPWAMKPCVTVAWWRKTPKAAKPRRPSTTWRRRGTSVGGTAATRNGGVAMRPRMASVRTRANRGLYTDGRPPSSREAIRPEAAPQSPRRHRPRRRRPRRRRPRRPAGGRAPARPETGASRREPGNEVAARRSSACRAVPPPPLSAACASSEWMMWPPGPLRQSVRDGLRFSRPIGMLDPWCHCERSDRGPTPVVGRAAGSGSPSGHASLSRRSPRAARAGVNLRRGARAIREATLIRGASRRPPGPARSRSSSGNGRGPGARRHAFGIPDGTGA